MKTDTLLPLSLPPIAADPLPEEPEGGLNVGRLLRTLQRQLWLIVGITLATTAAAGAKALTYTPTYSSVLEILVQPLTAESEVISSVPETLTSQGQQPNTTLNQDLLKILSSQQVLMPVVEKVKTRYPDACDAPLNEEIDRSEIINELCYRGIANSLRLGKLNKNSDILQVTFRDQDPQKVLTVLKATSEVYLDYSLESRQADIRRGVEFVEQKLPDLRAKVDSLQSQLQTIRADNNLINPESRGEQLSSQINSFSQTQLELQAQLQQARDVYRDLISQQPAETNASSALTENPRYQSLLDSLLAVDAQMAEASTLYLDTSPDMEVLKEQRQNLLALLTQQGQQSEQELSSKIRELEARQQAVDQTVQALNADVNQLSGISRRYTDIQRELQVATENLTQFLTKKEALNIDAAQREVPWEVITPPTEPTPQSENLPQNLLLGGLLGLLLGTGSALLLDKSGSVIYSDEDIRRVTRWPVLGRIPAQRLSKLFADREETAEPLQYLSASMGGSGYRDRHDLAASVSTDRHRANLHDSSPFSESFRSLYANIRLAEAKQSVRAIAVSSVMPSEGKSTVALYLAEAAAAIGQRVLLVDTNLRNPQVHQYLELSNEQGLTNLCSGTSNPTIVQKFSLRPNMYVITAGSAPFEPTSLFSSRNMQLFSAKVQKEFDLVIYDTPPLLGQSDAYLVANYTDGLLLVAQLGRLKQPLLSRAMEQLKVANTHILGVVIREP